MIEIIDDFGTVRIYNEVDKTFQLISPSIKINGVWENTNTEEYSTEVQEFCLTEWTPEIIEKYREHIDLNLVVEEE